MNFVHKELAAGKWQNLPFLEQMANIGSEISRTIIWKNKGNADYCIRAFERALELLWLTIDDPKNHTRARLKELTRTREALIDHFLCENSYSTTDKCWNRYFLQFAYAANLKRRGADDEGKDGILCQ
ncbi:MAG: hypothetical protein JW913_18375 [Chitinispirillaceae bacterium]|nr:hypothetical protein [Chitinispirillaceae bacterium]